MFSRIKLYLIAAVIFGVVGYGAWQYYKYTQAQIQAHAINAAKAEQALESTDTALKSMQLNLIQVKSQYTEVTTKFEEANARVKDLQSKLSRHEIGALAEAKPKLVEKIIDNGTKDVLRCFEIVSGSPLTEEELNAVKKSQTNSSCSDVANPNFIPK
jgi:predicted negative regulator of RcsB-dependent stress response